VRVGRSPLSALLSCLLIAILSSYYFISPLSEIAAFGVGLCLPEANKCRELHHPQHGKSKRVFRLLLARCILLSFKSLSTFLTSSLQKSSCHLLEESAIAAVPLRKRNAPSLESLLKSSLGLGVGGSSHKSCPGYTWISSPCTVHIRHWGCVFSLLLLFLSPCVPVLLCRETERNVSATESAPCRCFP